MTRGSSTTPSASTCRRDPNPHVGFGGPGPHFCLGAHLARRELSVIFRQLFTRLPDIEVVGDPVYLEAMGVPLVGGIKHLPVRFTPTRPGRGAVEVARPTAMDELFVHQIPELLPDVATRSPHWRESYFFELHRPDARGDVVFFTMAHFPDRAS